MIVDVLIEPFINYGFMCRAMVACCALSVSITPIGGFLILKRMSLMGDALSHAILPGVALGYFFCGVSCFGMSVGGFISGVIVAILSNWISGKTSLQKDASFSGLYLSALALGVVLMSINGSNIDLLHVLFGSILSIDTFYLKYVGVISSVTLISLAMLYRALIIEIFDPDFLKSKYVGFPRLIQVIFLLIVVLNLIASFRVIGTLMSVGLMMLPSLSAYCWVNNVINMLLLSTFIAILCSWVGLLGAFYISLPAGPAIVLCASAIFLLSVLFGRYKGIFIMS